MVRCSEGYDPLLRRPLSIHRVAPLSSPSQLALLFAIVGRGTKWLAQRKRGDIIDLLGPLGNGFEVHSHKLLLVAGGMGIAPLIALAQRGLAEGSQVTLLLGAPTKALLYPSHLLPGEVKPFSSTEDGSAGRKGLVTDLLADFAAEAGQIFACGPISMYNVMASQNALQGRSVQVSMEVRRGCG
ncbi:MAG: dihydroorotate dehydrogenase electron transfer subunit, partial [Dehalococcoidia bacterium]